LFEVLSGPFFFLLGCRCPRSGQDTSECSGISLSSCLSAFSSLRSRHLIFLEPPPWGSSSLFFFFRFFLAPFSSFWSCPLVNHSSLGIRPQSSPSISSVFSRQVSFAWVADRLRTLCFQSPPTPCFQPFFFKPYKMFLKNSSLINYPPPI